MNPTPRYRSYRAVYALVVPGILLTCMSPTTLAQPETGGEGGIMRGWRVFHEKQCATCHAVWDQGGHIGPDLGRSRAGHMSPARLAGTMWNHIPKMLSRMKATGHEPPALTRDEMADLFALLFFARSLDEPGDPGVGRELLQSRGCASCHSVDTSDGGIGPDLAKWGSYANPIIWSQMMWEHAPLMGAAMKQNGVSWPKLEGNDLVDIVAYVRSVGGSAEKVYLHPGSTLRGRKQFVQKGCAQCHPGAGPDLSTAKLPASVGALASRMWNHSPEMAKQMNERGVERQPITAQELADILAYVLALRNRDEAGSISRGEQIFTQKGCASCHERTEVARAVGPVVARLRRDAAPIDMATALWNHGEPMLQRMSEAGITWPVFGDGEMVDLLAFLRSLEASPKTSASPGSP